MNLRNLPIESIRPRVARAATTGLALLATLGALGLPPSAIGQEMEKTPALTPAEEACVDGFIAMAPAEGRQKLKDHCRELTRSYGDLHPLCDYLKSREQDNTTSQLLVVAALADGNLDLAAKTLGGLISREDPDLWALSEAARVQEMQGNDTGALATLNRALEKVEDPGMRFAMLVRQAQLLYDANQRDAARAAIRKILAEPEINQPEGRNYCARIAGLHGDYELVEELFTPIGEGQSLMRDLLYFGQILMHLEKPAAAGEPFAAALKLTQLQRDRRYVLDRIVSAAREADRLPGLIDEWLAAGEMLPEQLEILVGVLGGELDRAGDVLALLEREDSPAGTQKLIQSPAFQERMILVAMETGKSDLARRKFRDLIARHPKEFHYHNGYARLLLMEGEHAEAETFFRETIAATETVGGLMDLAASARNMAMEEVAMEAATKAGKMGELAHVQTVLFEAELHRQHGEADKTLDILRALEKEIGGDAALMVPLSEAYERYGYKADAIRLVRKAYDLTKGEKLLEKLISLLEDEQQYEQVFGLWRQLWETATEPMAIIQAQDRLLDIGSKNGKLADIAIELEERLDQGKLSDREQAMLLEIYTSVNDPVSAADILLDISNQEGGDRIGLYRRMIQVYMECELFGRCNAVLRKLVRVDPENRDDYLQSLALIALERKNDGDAVAVLQEHAASIADGILRDSFSASVLSMIGRHQEAARVYRRALADNPDEVETWLLWGNALVAMDQKARPQTGSSRSTTSSPGVGSKQATGMFSVLLEETGDDDMFTLAIDGMLNARAPRQVLPGALRRINERIALKPHKMFLYRLAADLHEELRHPDEVRMMLEQGVIVAEDGRSIIMRELIALAKASRKQDEVIRCGRSLLNTAEHLPPGECLELGTLLLDKGHFSEADSAFQRVIADGDVMGVTRDIILRYENAGLYGKAGKLLRQLLIGNPFDVELLLRLGIMEEKKGNLAAAHKAYQRSLDLMIGRLPRLSRKVEGEGGGGTTSSSRYGGTYSHNLDETKQYFELAAQGLITSARTPESRQQLLDTIRDRVRTELEKLEADGAFADTHDENPRLVQLTGLMRRLGFAFHRPEYFDPMDDDLLKRYPGDAGLLDSLKAQRSGWGLILNAREFQARNNKGEDDTFLLSPYLNDHDKLEKILGKQTMSSSSAETVLPLLAMCGHDDLMDTVLAGVDLKGMSQTVGNPLTSVANPLATAGLAASRADLVRNSLFNALSAAGRSNRFYDATGIQDQISAAWPVLNEEDRNSVTRQFGVIVGKMTGSRKKPALSFHHHLLCQVGRSGELDLKDLRDYVRGDINSQTSGSYAWATIVRWLLDKPEADRPGALRQLMEPHDARVRAVALTQLAMLLDDGDISGELEAVFRELFKSAALPASTGWPMDLVFSGYRENRLIDHVRMVMGDRANNGTGAGADKTCARFKSEIAGFRLKVAGDIRAIFMYHGTLRKAADALPPRQLDLILEDYVDSSHPVDMLISFILLRQAGRDSEALAVLHRIGALSADDPRAGSVRAAMPRILSGYGWDAHAPPFLADGADDPGARMKLYFQLHDPLALLGGNAGDPLASGARRMYAAMLMKDPAQFLQSARIYWADTRHPGVHGEQSTRYRLRSWPSRMAGAPGGLLGMESDSLGTTLDDLASLEGSQDELSYWLSAMPSTGHSFQSPVCNALAANVGEQGLSKRLHDEIETAAGRALLNRVDIETITAIAEQAPEQLPASLADQIPMIILFNRQSGSAATAALGRTCNALGLGHFAQSLSRWSVAWDLQTRGSSRALPDYLASLPEEARRNTLTALLPYMGINDIRLDAGGDEAALFTALLDLGMEAEATEMLDRYLRRLRLIDMQSASGYRFRPYYQARMGGGESDHAGGTLQDALAVALARLNRPDDYQRTLKRRALLEQTTPRQQSTTNRVMMVSGSGSYVSYQSGGTDTNSAPADLTRALPEPDQVGDINRYIDIHLELNAWLRDLGYLSRENHVAQICILGAWCAKRGLNGRATGLLALADGMSEGMLTGRLWIADLHRLLGEEEPAADIEAGLLRHDLLPMSRVPSALKTVAAKEGQAQADAIAHQVCSYSNHPQVLPLALRHAGSEGMKEPARDLADRLRKVSTLFLPPY